MVEPRYEKISIDGTIGFTEEGSSWSPDLMPESVYIQDQGDIAKYQSLKNTPRGVVIDFKSNIK